MINDYFMFRYLLRNSNVSSFLKLNPEHPFHVSSLRPFICLHLFYITYVKCNIESIVFFHHSTIEWIFRAIFGVSSAVCANLSVMIRVNINTFAQPIHLLLCLYFLKDYCTEHVSRIILNASENTIRSWSF